MVLLRSNIILVVYSLVAQIRYICGISKQPNIVIIIGDDIGWNDFGFHGSNQISTPNIDALGYNGVILDKFYTQHICTPSRAAFLTGKYPIRTGFQGTPINAGENRSLPFDAPLLPEKLKTLGYKTHLVGKWHLGAAKREDTPTKRGFDSHFGYWNGYIGYFDYSIDVAIENGTVYHGYDLHSGFKPEWGIKGQYATEAFTKKALEVIEKHDVEEPLFLILSHLAAHTGANDTELGVLNITETNEKYGYINEPMRRRYADVIKKMDDSIGEVVKKLGEKQMLENSVVLFFSDNGAPTIGLYNNYGSNWPFRGIKSTLLEGGVRGSAVLWSPLLEKKGSVNKQLIHITDFMPTFYHLAAFSARRKNVVPNTCESALPPLTACPTAVAYGGDIKDLGDIDGINQWTAISKDAETKRTEILLNIDEAKNFSGLLDHNGRYKLIYGSFENGEFDQYYGESGRGQEIPEYNISQILISEVNIAITNLNNQDTITKESIFQQRNATNRVRDQSNDYIAFLNCTTTYCLFDIFEDPCETRNIIEELPEIASAMKLKLENYYLQIVTQLNTIVDPNSNPALCNGTWFPWLDHPGCYNDDEYVGCFNSASKNSSFIAHYLRKICFNLFIIIKTLLL